MTKQWGKRLVPLLLAASVCASSFAGCSKKDEGQSGTSSQTQSSVSSEGTAGGGSASANYSEGLTDNGYFANVNALSYVTLPDYKNMEIPEDTANISAEAVESELNSRAQNYAEAKQITDREVKDGDSVNIDYVGSVDGVEFEGGNTQGNGTTVTIGVTNYIDDFLEQLIGHKPGDTFDVNVTFPEDYGVEDLNGKDAVFVTTVNYIQETVIPEVTDDFVASNWKSSEGWSNRKDAEKGVKEELRQKAVSDYLWQQIQTQAEVSEIPREILDFQERRLRNYYSSAAAQYNMDVEEFVQQAAQAESLDALVETNRAQLEESGKSDLIFQALSEDMKLNLTDEDFAVYFENNTGSATYSQYESIYGLPYLALLVREDLVLQKLGELK